MSVITDVMVCAHMGEKDAIEALDAFLARWYGATPAPKLACAGPSAASGGNKVASYSMWGGAFNHLDDGDFLEAAKTAPWRFPDWVVIIMWCEFRDLPLVWTVKGDD